MVENDIYAKVKKAEKQHPADPGAPLSGRSPEPATLPGKVLLLIYSY